MDNFNPCRFCNGTDLNRFDHNTLGLNNVITQSRVRCMRCGAEANEEIWNAPLPGVEGVTGAPDPGPLPLEVPNVNLVAWEDGEKVITVGGKVVGCTLTEQDGRIIRDWLDTAIREIWEMRALDHEDFPAPQLRARLIQRINENDLLLEQLESVHRLWLDWRENGMANAITKAGEYMHKIGKVVDPSYPPDRLRAALTKAQGSR